MEIFYVLSNLLTFHTECRIVFAAQFSGPKGDLSDHLHYLATNLHSDVKLILFDSLFNPAGSQVIISHYNDVIPRTESSRISDLVLIEKESLVKSSDVLNIQFTSGQ
jgi:hypothetical protein